MLTILLSLLGVGGVAGLALRFLAPGLISKGMGLFDRLPKWLVYGLAALLVLGIAYFWHGHVVKVAYREAYAAGEKDADRRWKGAFAEMKRASGQWRQNYEKRSSQLSDALRTAHEQDLRRIAADADDLRLRGPGRAAAPGCRPGSAAGLGPAAGQGGQPAPGPGAPASPLPAGDRLAIVPWGWTVRQAEEHDQLLAEVKLWRTWYVEEGALYSQAKADLRARLDAIKVPPPGD